MTPLTQLLFVLGLGAFWGFSPALNKIMGDHGLPVTHILVLSGFGVGLGLLALQRLMGNRLQLNRQIAVYGICCAVLLNVPWFGSLTVVRHVPVTVSAVIISTSPLWTYALAVLLRRERATSLRLLALCVGFLSSLVVILTRDDLRVADVDASFGGFGINGWVLVAMTLPILYAIYNTYTSMAWPKGMTASTAGIVESFATTLVVLPLVPLLEPVGFSDLHTGYWLIGLATAMWILERVCYFSMIERAGPVTTVQAIYVATPAAVVFGLVLFGEPASVWLWISLALLMLALWLNNRALTRAHLAAEVESVGVKRIAP
jgi:drug/metabolite transporter (DMT)-like permease